MSTLSDKDKSTQREVERRIRDLNNLLHDLGGTRRGSPQFASPELAYANRKLREAGHWVREHYFTNVMSQNNGRPAPRNGDSKE